jgi:hypothetical protein
MGEKLSNKFNSNPGFTRGIERKNKKSPSRMRGSNLFY